MNPKILTALFGVCIALGIAGVYGKMKEDDDDSEEEQAMMEHMREVMMKHGMEQGDIPDELDEYQAELDAVERMKANPAPTRRRRRRLWSWRIWIRRRRGTNFEKKDMH